MTGLQSIDSTEMHINFGGIQMLAKTHGFKIKVSNSVHFVDRVNNEKLNLNNELMELFSMYDSYSMRGSKRF